MKGKVFIVVSLMFSLFSGAFAQEITMQSLLREMVDRDAVTVFPIYRTLQASSYNRASVSPDQPGWFADSDGVSCIRTEQNADGETEWVLMEDDGPGAIVKIWAVCFYYSMSDLKGANVRIYLDGEKQPTIDCNFFEFVKGQNFVKPPFAEESTRAGNCYLPIPYSKGCKVTMDKKVFYNIINYRHYPEGTKVRTFSFEDYKSSEALIDSVGAVLSAGCSRGNADATDKTLAPGKSMQITVGNHRPGAIRRIRLRVSGPDSAQALRSTVMKASFDGEETIWSPVGDFFNIGVGTKPYRMWERTVEDDGTMICQWVMPYRKKGVLRFENLSRDTVTISVSVETGPYRWTDRSMYFHSCWRMDEPTPGFPLFDYNFVKVHGSGLYVGDQMTVLNPAEGWWGEGDEKVYVDGETFPSHFGTGTEDYYGWAGGIVPNPVDEFFCPFLSNVRVAFPNSKGYNTCTRTRSLDAIPFVDSLNFNLEASGSRRNSWFHMLYSVNSYWYAKPGASHNRKPLPWMASRKIMTLEELQSFNEERRKTGYAFPGAIEAENISTYRIEGNVSEAADPKIWGELSGGKAKSFSFAKAGDTMELRLTEVFCTTPLRVCLATQNTGGEFEIRVNGEISKNVNLLSEHSAVATIDLGDHDPVGNQISVEFVCVNPGILTIDYLTVE